MAVVDDDGGRQWWTTPMWRRRTAWGGGSVGRRGKRVRQPGAVAGGLAWQTREAATTVAGNVRPASGGREGGGGGWSGGRRRWAGGRASAGGGQTAGGWVATGGGRASVVGTEAGGRARRLLLGTERRKRNEHRGYWLIRITPVGQSTRPTGVKLFPSALMTGRRELLNRHRLGL
jgi:hypothetical protein